MSGPALDLEEPPTVMAGFPEMIWYAGTAVRRITRAGNGVWWFSGDLTGRFDLSEGRGTCYFGVDAVGALCEVFRRQPVLDSDIDGRRVNDVLLRHDVQLANTTHLHARRYGVTKELATAVPYALPQRWAARFDESAFGGVFHHLRHDPRPRGTGVALFGPAGAADAHDWETSSTSRPVTLVELDKAGIRTRPRPSSLALHVR